MKLKDPQVPSRLNGGSRRKVTSTSKSTVDRSGIITSDKESAHFQPNRFTRNSEGTMLRSSAGETRKSASPEKEERYYTTRGSVGGDDAGKVSGDGSNGDGERAVVWPKVYIALTRKEKEEDFLAMKGCKPAQRPKKRAKMIQRNILLVSPGEWLSDICKERYEVKEKKSNKKRPRGLKAMASMESNPE